MQAKSQMQKTIEHGAEFWNDSCDLHELEKAYNSGATGSTSNPVIVNNVLEKNKDLFYSLIKQATHAHPSSTESEISWHVIEKLAQKSAAILEPIYHKSKGKQGKLCVQVNPVYYQSSERMVKHAIQLANIAPNIAIKIPALKHGITAIEELTALGITINATVSFSTAQAMACADAVERGLKTAKKNNLNTDTVTPYITLMVGRIDDYIERCIKTNGIIIDPSYAHWAGVSVFKKTYNLFQERNYKSKILAAAYRHHLHWSQLIGPNLVLSIPYKWWNLFNHSDIKVQETINHPVPEDILHGLCEKVKEFNIIYNEDGLHLDSFHKNEASIHTLKQFLGGVDQMNQAVRSYLLSQ